MKILHPLVQAAKLELLRLDKKKEVTREDHEAYYCTFLPISVEPKLRIRALSFMDVLINLVEKNGHNIVFEYNRCHIKMYGYSTEINLRQKYFIKRIKDEKGYAFETSTKSDKLEFQIGSYYRKNWVDRKTITLEEYLPKIYSHIEKESKRFAEIWEINRLKEENDKKLKAVEAEKQRIIEIEKDKTNNLIKDAENHFIAAKIRAYIKALEDNTQPIQLTKELDYKYIKWAKKKADEIDPIKNQV